jgi:hypothetical protein
VPGFSLAKAARHEDKELLDLAIRSVEERASTSYQKPGGASWGQGHARQGGSYGGGSNGYQKQNDAKRTMPWNAGSNAHKKARSEWSTP